MKGCRTGTWQITGWSRKSITLHTQGGRIDVSALVTAKVPGLAINERVPYDARGRWAVTHIHTGNSIFTRCACIQSAQWLVLQLQSLADWEGNAYQDIDAETTKLISVLLTQSAELKPLRVIFTVEQVLQLRQAGHSLVGNKLADSIVRAVTQQGKNETEE